jgi:hypothetical protein
MLGSLLGVFAIPWSFLSGFFTGLAAPLVAIAGVVAGVRFLTGKVPFLGHAWDDEESGRHLSFKLVAPDQVQELFDEQKEQIGGDIVKMKDEIQAIIEEAKAKAVAQQESEGSAPEA